MRREHPCHHNVRLWPIAARRPHSHLQGIRCLRRQASWRAVQRAGWAAVRKGET